MQNTTASTNASTKEKFRLPSGTPYISPAKASDPTIMAIKNGRFDARRTGRLGLALIEGHADDERFA